MHSFRCLLVFMFPLWLNAQQISPTTDTLRLTIDQAEKILLDKNLQLIANHFNIDIAQAQVIAAKLWDNPTLNFDINVWNQVSKKPFDFITTAPGTSPPSGGEIYFHIEQIFKTAGKRHRLVEYNKANVRSTEYAYYDLLRNLKFQFRSDFYTLNALLHSRPMYLMELEKSKALEKALSMGLEHGNISMKDLVTLQSTIFQLQNDILNNATQITTIEADMKNLLQLQPDTVIVPDVPELTTFDLPVLSLDSLYTSAIANRPDVLSNREQVTANNWNVKYNKALVAPDVTVGTEYDKANTWEPNYVGLFISLPLPLWNFNGGGIKQAKATLKQSLVQLDASKLKAVNDVNSAYEELLELVQLNIKTQAANNAAFTKLMDNIYEIFQRREMNIRDLTLFMDSYKQQITLYNNYISQYRIAKENLNLVVGKDVLK